MERIKNNNLFLMLILPAVIIVINFLFVGAEYLYMRNPDLFPTTLDSSNWLEFLGILLGIVGSFFIYFCNKKDEIKKVRVEKKELELKENMETLTKCIKMVNLHTPRIILEDLTSKNITLENGEEVLITVNQIKKAIFEFHKQASECGIETFILIDSHPFLKKLEKLIQNYCNYYLIKLIEYLGIYQGYIQEIGIYKSIILQQKIKLEVLRTYDEQVKIYEKMKQILQVNSHQIEIRAEIEKINLEIKTIFFEKNKIYRELEDLSSNIITISKNISENIMIQFLKKKEEENLKIRQIESGLEKEKQEIISIMKEYMMERKNNLKIGD